MNLDIDVEQQLNSFRKFKPEISCNTKAALNYIGMGLRALRTQVKVDGKFSFMDYQTVLIIIKDYVDNKLINTT